MKIDNLINSAIQSRSLRRTAANTLHTSDLSYGEFEVLYTLKQQPSAQPSEIAGYLVHEPASVSRMLKSLLQKSLINYSYDMADRRKVYVDITASGKKKLDSISKKLKQDNNS